MLATAHTHTRFNSPTISQKQFSSFLQLLKWLSNKMHTSTGGRRMNPWCTSEITIVGASERNFPKVHCCQTDNAAVAAGKSEKRTLSKLAKDCVCLRTQLSFGREKGKKSLSKEKNYGLWANFGGCFLVSKSVSWTPGVCVERTYTICWHSVEMAEKRKSNSPLAALPIIERQIETMPRQGPSDHRWPNSWTKKKKKLEEAPKIMILVDVLFASSLTTYFFFVRPPFSKEPRVLHNWNSSVLFSVLLATACWAQNLIKIQIGPNSITVIVAGCCCETRTKTTV